MVDRYLTIGELATRTGVATSACYRHPSGSRVNFTNVVAARLAGQPLGDAHPH